MERREPVRLQPRKFYGSQAPAIAIVVVCAAVTPIILLLDDQSWHRSDPDLWWIFLPIILLWAGWFLWRRRRYPIAQVADDRLCINPDTMPGREQCVPLEKIRSIRLGTYVLLHRSIGRSYSQDVDAYLTTTVDGRKVPPIIIRHVRRRQRDDLERLVTELNDMAQRSAIAVPPPHSSGTHFSNTPFQLRPRADRRSVIAAFNGYSTESHRASDGRGHTVSVADLPLWNLNGYLRAEFDEEDRLIEAVWNSTPGLHITEQTLREIVDGMERGYGVSTGDERLGWRRSIDGIEAELRGVRMPAGESYELVYSERVLG